MISLILKNPSVEPLELIKFGITIPAEDQYDISRKNRDAISRSEELVQHITDGTLLLIKELEPEETYWSVADALRLLAFGVNVEALGLGVDGSLQMTRGTTAERPVDPVGGMFRYNTETRVVEMFQSGTWNNMPLLGASEQRQLGEFMFVKNDLGNFVSSFVSSVKFGSKKVQNLTWLQINDEFTGSQVGYITAYPMSITMLNGFTDDTTSKSISLYVDDVEYTNQISFTGEGVTDNVNQLINVNVEAGQKVRFRVKSNTRGGLGAVSLTVYFRIRAA